MNRMPSEPAMDLEVSGKKTLHPTPDILDALEKDYPLEASVADLVDNSIDAGARHVLIRFARRGPTLQNLYIVDDGCGMDATTIERAMQFAARRTYGPKDLGMFGIGMKTASLSQADAVTVLSRCRGNSPVGRQWTKSGIKMNNWSMNILTQRSATSLLERPWGLIAPLKKGTIVRWDHVYDFERIREGVEAYLERAIVRIQRHLGLKLHRFLERRQIKIQVDVEDLDLKQIGPPSIVRPTNPLPPKTSRGATGYPKEFHARLPREGVLKLQAHIWRKKSSDEGYKLGGGRVAEHQGFYFYRHDRLIQDGGWCEIIGTNEPHLSLARVEVDIPDRLQTYLKVRSNKAGVDVPATFADAIFAARSKDGTPFRTFIEKAEEVYRHRGEQQARPMMQPGDGVPAEVRNALERKDVRFLRGRGCSILWDSLPGTSFFNIDQENRRIILNAKYRKMLLRGAHGGKTDLPLLRTLLYFVFESLLAGDRIGRAERLRVEALQASMGAALKLEQRWANE
jgi:hypothetical protein